MPLDGSGIAVRLPDTIAISGQTIESDKYNREINDIYSVSNQPRPVSSGGTGADNPADALANLGGISAANVLAKYISYVVAQTLTDAQKIQARANIGAAPDTVTGVLVGSFIWVATAAAPTGYLKANGLTIGSALSGATGRANADAAALFTVLWNNVPNTVLPIQNSLGANVLRGTTAAIDFAANKRLPLPDMRGEFVRSFSDGRAGVDVGRVLGSAQAEMIGPHTHAGTTSTSGSHSHTLPGGGGSGDPSAFRDGSGSTPNGITSTAGAHSHTLTTDENSGTENRVRNIALLCCIKY
jgi:hypothetical protein